MNEPEIESKTEEVTEEIPEVKDDKVVEEVKETKLVKKKGLVDTIVTSIIG